MAFGIPDEVNAGFTPQAGVDAVDFDIIAAANNRFLVVSGCAVTQHAAGANMSVDVAAGVVAVAGVRVATAGGNPVVTTANATNPRFDLVCCDNTGAVSVTAGVAAANPVFPAIPANSVVLAAIYVPATDTAINTNQIIDKRMLGVETDVQVFTSSGTWTKPPNVSMVMAIAYGAGGGGGGGSAGGVGSGGGGGAQNEGVFQASDLGATETITVGAGGTGGPSGGTAGTGGGSSSFGSHLTAYGGGCGAATSAAAAAGGGGGRGGAGGNGLLAGASGAGGTGMLAYSAGDRPTNPQPTTPTNFGGGGGGVGGNAGVNGGCSVRGAGGGGGGGQNGDGGAGGKSGVYTNAGGGGTGGSGTNIAGGNGANATDLSLGGAGGGGGNGGSAGGTAGNGGAGGTPGGGGAGGGEQSLGTGGAGGTGARGQVVVISW